MLKKTLQGLAAIGLAYIGRKQSLAPSDWTFKDLVRDPKLARHVMSERELDPDKVTDDDIHHIIDGLCHEEVRDNCAEWIKQLTPRATTIAIGRLNDESLLEEVGPRSFPLRDLIPAVTGMTDPAVLARLRELAQDERPHLRKLAGEVLAGAGMEEDAEVLIRLLKDEVVAVRDSVLFGLILYYKDREYAHAIIGALYPEIRSTIGKKRFMLEHPAVVLFRLDKQRAAADLSDPKLWAHDAPEGMEIVNAFIAAKVRPPIEALEMRVKGFARSGGDETGAYHLARSFELLSKHDLDRAAPFLDSASTHPDKKVRKVARECRCRIAGIVPPRDKLWAMYKFNPNTEYDEHQAVIAAISATNGEIENGGFEQYLWNGTADGWPKHRDALREIGADEHLAVLDRVTGLFGKAGPPTDREARFKPLAKVARKHGETLDQCNSKWYDLDEKLDTLLIEFALKHPNSFRPISS